MSEPTDVLQVARPGECNMQQQPVRRATAYATGRALTALQAASLRVLARNTACNSCATTPERVVQQTALPETAFVAAEDSIGALLGELHGLFARVLRHRGFSAIELAEARETGAKAIGEALQCFRELAARIPEVGLPSRSAGDCRVAASAVRVGVMVRDRGTEGNGTRGTL